MTSPRGYEEYERWMVQWLLADHPLLLAAAVGVALLYAVGRSRAEFAGRRGPMGFVVGGLVLNATAVVGLAHLGWPLVDAIIAGGLAFVAVLLVDALLAGARLVRTAVPAGRDR